MAIEDALSSRLSTIVTSASHYLRHIPQGVSQPFIHYQLMFEDRDNAMGSDTGLIKATYQFDVYTSSIALEKTVVGELLTAFLRFRGTLDTTVIQATFLRDRRDGYNDKLQEETKQLDFEFWYLE